MQMIVCRCALFMFGFASLCLSTAQIQAALVAHYRFDELSGTTAIDAAGGDDNGTIGSAVAYSSPKIGASALTFANVTNSTVNLGAGQDLVQNVAGATLMTWINTGTITGQGNMIALSHNANSGQIRAGLNVSNGNKVAGRGRDGDGGSLQTATSTPAYNANQWTHVATTINYATDTITVFINGVPVSSSGGVAFTNTSTPNTTSLSSHLGSINNGGERFIGQMDDPAIFNTIESNVLIRSVYELGNQAGLAYDVSNALTLWDLYNAASGSAVINQTTTSNTTDTKTWFYSTGLDAGRAVGEAWLDGGNYFLKLDASGNGVATIPEPGIVGIGFLLVGSALVWRRQSTRS